MGDKPADKIAKTEGEGETPEEPLFPHIYGPIDSASVIAELAVTRSAEGAFLSIEGLA